MWQRSVPDTAPRFAIGAAGRLKLIGRVRSTGVALGTGFIPFGRETLQLKLTVPGGQITIVAHSELVPGFTTP